MRRYYRIHTLIATICLYTCTFLAVYGQAGFMFISSIDKSSGPGESTLTISGGGFGTSTADLVVFFGGASSSPTSAQDGLLEVKVPAGATFDNITVVNISSGLQASSSAFFTLSFGQSTFDEANFSSSSKELTDLIPPNNTLAVPFYNLSVCDLDNDGDMDVVGAASSAQAEDIGIRAFTIFRNTTVGAGGSPTFALPQKILTGSPVHHVVCGDVNNDGLADIVVAQASQGGTSAQSNIFYVRNTTPAGGDITFAPANLLTLPVAEGQDILRGVGKVFIKDIDKDGKADIIANNRLDNRLFIFRNSSLSGSETAFIVQGTDTGDDVLWGMDVKDLNQDGLPDIVLGKINASIHVLINNSTPGNISFAPSRELANNSGRGSLRNLIIGDINQDDKQDIVVTSDDGNLLLWLLNTTSDEQNAGATLAFESNFTRLELSAGGGPWGLDLGDVDGDGKLDLLLSTIAKEGPYILHNTSADGNVSFTEHDLAQHKARNVRIADVNNDGKPDLLLANAETGGSNQIRILLNAQCVKPVITPDTGTACSGGEFVIGATPAPGATYAWTATPTGGGGTVTYNSQTNPFMDVSAEILAIGNYTITVEASVGTCQVTSEQTRDIERLGGAVIGAPTLAIASGGNSACIGSDVIIQSTLPAGVTLAGHHWMGPAGTENDVAQWELSAIQSKQAGKYTYYYTATLSGGGVCPSSSVDLTLSVRNLPTVLIQSALPYGCSGQAFSVELTGTGTHTAINTFQWRFGTSNIANATAITHVATQPGSYTLRYGDGTCNRETLAIPLSQIAPPSVTLGDMSIWCKGTPYVPQVTAVPSPGASDIGLTRLAYLWDMGDGTPPLTDPIPRHTYSGANDYTVSVDVSYADADAAFPCKGTKSTHLRLIDTPTIDLLRTPDREKKCPIEEVTIAAPEVAQIQGGGTTRITSYLWSSGETTNHIAKKYPGTYKLTAKDDAGCTIEVVAEVANADNSGISLQSGAYPFSADTLTIADLPEGEQVEITVQRAYGIISWARVGRWKEDTPEYLKQRWPRFTLGLDTTSRMRPLLKAYYDELALGPYLYRVQATDQANCQSEAIIKLTLQPDQLLEGYAIFSPDNDNQNDRWKIYKLDLVAINGTTCRLNIFDRRGSLVYNKASVDANWAGWDGTNRGKPLPEDVYFYTLTCTCPADQDCPRGDSGSFLLIRGD